jgi:hypothetical protein
MFLNHTKCNECRDLQKLNPLASGINIYTVKPANAVTSIKQSPVLKGHIFLVLSLKISYELNLF